MFRFSFRSFPGHLRATVLALCLFATAFCIMPGRAQSSQDPVYVFHTDLGNINVQLYPDIAPKTVANFLNYVNSGAYANTFFHRSVSNFVIQGGGYTIDDNTNVNTINTNASVVNEFHISNTRGTISMAKLGNDPNSATSQWFFNEKDNSANLDKTNGGYTVFGKITDSASLAVMDKISALQIVNAGSPFDELPVRDYTSGAAFRTANFTRITSIIPPSSYAAASVSVGGDGNSRLLWNRSDGAIAVWKLDSQGQFLANVQYGPYAGWTGQAIATGKDNTTHLLWTNVDGTASVYLLDSSNKILSQQQFGPYTGWTAKTLAVAPNNTVRLLWTNADGTASVYTLDSTNHKTGQQQYGPYTDWTARSVTVGTDGLTRILWTNKNGTASLWRLNAQGQLQDQQQYGPYDGWTAASVAAAPDGTFRIVWQNTDGHIALWTVSSAGMMTGQYQYGPYSGWLETGLAMGPGGNAYFLWDNVSRQAALWSLKPDGSFASNYQFGPY